MYELDDRGCTATSRINIALEEACSGKYDTATTLQSSLCDDPPCAPVHQLSGRGANQSSSPKGRRSRQPSFNALSDGRATVASSTARPPAMLRLRNQPLVVRLREYCVSAAVKCLSQ